MDVDEKRHAGREVGSAFAKSIVDVAVCVWDVECVGNSWIATTGSEGDFAD